MHPIGKVPAITLSIALAACQTLDGVTLNGASLDPPAPVEAAQGANLCERFLVLCVAGGIVVFAAGAILLGDFIAAEN